MQNKLRFGELHNVCFNEENYPYDIFRFLEPFRGNQFRAIIIHEYPLDTKPDNFLKIQDISDEVKQRFERDISPIQSKDFNGIAFFSNPYIGNWYLKEINENSIVGYYNAIPNSSSWIWYESRYDLKYKESEIVYCIMKKLGKYYKQNQKFEIEFNKYKAFFDGTLAEFLECLLNEHEDFYYFTNLGFNYYYMNKIEGYDGLKDRLTEMVNNLSTPDHVEVGKAVKVPQQEYKNLPDLFHKKEDFDFAISVLKNVEKPVIGEANNYRLGKNGKGAFSAWINVLSRKGLIKTSNETIIVPLLESYFTNLSITDRTLRNTPTKAYNQYFTDFGVLYSIQKSS